MRAANPFRLALFWLGLQAVWGALLGISLQARSIELVAVNPLLSYSWLATGGALVAAVVQVLVGPWSDARRRTGSRRIEFYVAGTIGGALSIVGFYVASSFAELALAFVALQLTINVAIGPYQAIVPDTVERDRFGVASSWLAAFQSVGNAIGALCASAIANGRALGATLAALLVATSAVTIGEVKRLPLQSPPAHEKLRITKAFVDLFISRALVYVGFFTLVDYLLFYVTGVLGVAPGAAAQRETGILILSFTIVGAGGAALAARPSDRMDKRLVATLGGAGFVVALLVFIASHSFYASIAATAIAGLGWGVFLVADWAIACRILPPGALASTMGIWNVAIAGPQGIAPLLTGSVLGRLGLAASAGGPKVAFGLAVGETVLGIAWLWRLSRCAIGE